MHTSIRKSLAVTAVASLAMFTAACGSDDEPSTTSGGDTPASEDGMSDDQTSEGGDDAAASTLVGPGCADYAEAVPDGAGSVDGMAQDPVAVAASNNPLLKTLTAAVSGQVNKKVDLVDTLNGGEFTVFAPVDDAFAQIDEATLKMLSKPAHADMLSTILTYHVVEGQLSPDQVVGEQATVAGDAVEVSGSGDELQVNDANVICGGVQTANATVYLIDAVLMPPSM